VGNGQGVADLWEDTVEELNATVDTTVWFPELRMKSQYAQEITPVTGAHNSRRIDQRQPVCSVLSLCVWRSSYSPPRPSQPRASRKRRRRAEPQTSPLQACAAVPNPGLLLHRVTQVECAIGRVRLGMFNMSLCVVEPAFIAKQPCEFVMNPK
jgi:hypothetical protein